MYCVIVVKHVAFFAVCATLTMAVTLTSFAPLFPDVVVVSDLNKNICRSTDLAKKGTDLHTPIHSPLQWIIKVYIREDTIYHLLV